MTELTPKIRDALLALDTPTICNALETVNPERRARGFNIRPFVCARPSLSPILGYARTARIRAAHKPEERFDADAYYSYIAEGGPTPSIAIIEDIDENVKARAIVISSTGPHFSAGMDPVSYTHLRAHETLR